MPSSAWAWSSALVAWRTPAGTSLVMVASSRPLEGAVQAVAKLPPANSACEQLPVCLAALHTGAGFCLYALGKPLF